jgi:hypothetical protein
MEPEIEKSWRLAKESRPGAVAFVRSGDIYFLRGDDVETIRREFGIRCFGDTVGFDPHEAWSMMRQLAQGGRTVLRVERTGVREVPPDGHKPRIRRPRGQFIALDPALLFDTAPLMRMKVEQRPYEVFCDLLSRNDLRGLRDHGEIYVFEFDGIYEVDWELTSMLPSRAFMLARAALDTGEKMPCRLVLPRAWRNRRKRRKKEKVHQPQPVELGQMRLNL